MAATDAVLTIDLGAIAANWRQLAEAAAPGAVAGVVGAVAARKLYAKDVKARESADAIVDNTDPENPVRIFADSC